MTTRTKTKTKTKSSTATTTAVSAAVVLFLSVVTEIVAGFTFQEFGSSSTRTLFRRTGRRQEQHGQGESSISSSPFVLTTASAATTPTTRKSSSITNDDDNDISRDVFVSRLLILAISTGAAVSSSASTTATATTTTLPFTLLLAPAAPCYAFDGGVGGLGKTKPNTGVVLWDESSPPTQDNKRSNNGLVTTEIQSASSNNHRPRPIRVSFESPSYPLSTSAGGLEVRDVRSTESAYVFVLPATRTTTTSDGNNFQILDDPKSFREVLIGTVFSSQGKYGAYSPPTDITVKKLILPPTTTATATSTQQQQQQQNRRLFSVTFTTLTPAMRESLRQVWIVAQPVYDDTIVCFIVGTTKAKFDENRSTFEQMVNSFVAVEAPPSSLRRSSVSSSSSSSK